MDITQKTIWQQAAGDTDRNYSNICRGWDVILNGPGSGGPWPGVSNGLSSRKITDLRRFAVDMKDGDLVVLRLGTANVIGVGQIAGDYEWHDEFGDIDGWELQHVRRVRWLWMNLSNPKIFDTYALKQGDTTQKLSEGSVTDWLKTLPVSNSNLSRHLVELPVQKRNDITVTEISEFLFDHGVASVAITNLLSEIGELTRIAKWYQRSSSRPSEHETVAYLIVPLLRALGWTPQRMAVEWNYVDVALFEQLPRSNETLRIVVEAKKMDNSCLTAISQAESYADGKASCHRLIVTDGLRYGIYTRSKMTERFKLYAYLNLTRLRSDYPIYECKGAEEALLAMTPEWKPNGI